MLSYQHIYHAGNLDKRPAAFGRFMVNHDNLSDRMAFVPATFHSNFLQTTADGSKRKREGRDEGRKRY